MVDVEFECVSGRGSCDGECVVADVDKGASEAFDA